MDDADKRLLGQAVILVSAAIIVLVGGAALLATAVRVFEAIA